MKLNFISFIFIFILIIAVLIIAAILATTAVNLQNSSFDVGSEKAERVACSTERVPYQETEYYQSDFNFEVISSNQKTSGFFNIQAVGEVSVRNVELTSGEFKVIQYLETLNRPTETSTSSRFILPGETIVFTSEFDISRGEDFNILYEVSPPEKTLSREITKYRDVEICN